ncbi:hypothetical protein N7474_005624 [Penicillium riverlandense]|uniref:uncharacterized protein n=1 Tax=Penicillium riverlandense TaxID=1903569 RepID=UPI002546C3AD|nr:uncharacterized protein N7474_005624 [Penicillium riverlandense]KAJ5820033.1 hypothetical protein N7474_005624 [Penicillium riverlandense]
MSTPSTPRSTRSASSAAGSPNILTPGQKIKAMMAAFDSDSEGEPVTSKSRSFFNKPDFARTNTIQETRQSSDEEDEDDEVGVPRGRMAARLQGNTTNRAASESKGEESAFARLSKALRTEREQAQKPTPRKEEPVLEDESSDDDLPAAGPRRRNNTGLEESSQPENELTQALSPTRELSPLFVSAQDNTDSPANDSAKESSKKNARFLALVAQKRKEREERETIEAEKKAARRAQMEQFSSEILSGEESAADEDPESARKLTQQTRPPRKASKKALQEMRAETQRMSRNMQLAHQAQTKKKITKDSLFARFNFMQPETPAEAAPAAANSSSTAGSQPSSDGEGSHKNNDTPQTSPVVAPSDKEKPATSSRTALGRVTAGAADMEALVSEETPDLPNLEEAMELDAEKADAPKEPALEKVKSEPQSASTKKAPYQFTHRPIRVMFTRQQLAQHQAEDDSDNDLEVVTSPAKCRRIAAFENLSQKKNEESASMIKLKALAHLTSPTRQAASMNNAELSASLLLKARQQAAKGRQERIEELRAKGVVIETVEERAAMEDDVEDLLTKARKEADDIARQENKESKQNGNEDEDEDDDFVLSGSDEEGYGAGEDEDDEDEENDVASVIGNNEGLIENEAAEDESDEFSAAESDVPKQRRKRPTRVLSDDEDDEQPQREPPSTPVRPPIIAADSASRTKIPGLETSDNMSMGLTQAFAGTLGDNDSQPGSATIPFSLPDPGPPVPQLRRDDSEVLVRDSQAPPDEADFMADYRQNVTRVSESPARYSISGFSQLPDPTQDEGFVFSPFDPRKRFNGTPPVSTVDTVLIGQGHSPIANRKARHLRRGRAAEAAEDDEGDFEIDANAFNVMKKAAKTKNKAGPYDKENSRAKEIFDEAAEESEDEYAGIGGASDEEDAEENAEDRRMINDNSGEVVDEKELAALNAVHQRTRDEKDVAKLMRDITTGALRRRHGADDDFDLDDSDDERQARRREKQREFAKMRRALLADDKVGELADNPKKAAFFKAIEDREESFDFDLDFLDEKQGDSQEDSSQDVRTEERSTVPATETAKRKRPLEESAEDTTNRPPPHLRRTPATAASKKPASLAEIRETLSFLTETHDYDSFHEDASLDEDAGTTEENDDAAGADAQTEEPEVQTTDHFPKPSHPRRTRGPVVDRLALLRQASSNSASGSEAANTKLAFHSGGGKDGPIGFRPPQLLRRVTSSSSSSKSSSSSHRVTKPGTAGPKKGGAVNSYTAAREREREKALRLQQRNGGSSIAKLLNKHAGGGLGALAGKGQWD